MCRQADDGEAAEEPRSPFPFGGRKLESAATVAERQVGEGPEVEGFVTCCRDTDTVR